MCFFYSQQKQPIGLQFSAEIKFKSICIEFCKLWGKRTSTPPRQTRQLGDSVSSPHHLVWSFTVDSKEISSINSSGLTLHCYKIISETFPLRFSLLS